MDQTSMTQQLQNTPCTCDAHPAPGASQSVPQAQHLLTWKQVKCLALPRLASLRGGSQDGKPSQK